MSSWSDGYVSDVEYMPSVNREQAAEHLALASLISGHEPPPLGAGYRYCELGCGHGLTLNLLAATDPAGRFVGIDFNPVHTLLARQFAAAAELDNVSFHEAGFEELARDGAPYLEPFDVVALHGVYSWVSPENRGAIVALLRRYVKPGGMVYITYNAMPGWGAGQTLQRLLIGLADADTGRSDRRVVAAIKFASEMQRVGAITPEANLILEEVCQRVGRGEERYLVHEYLNQYWSALYFAEVAGDLAEAKLGFVASGALLDNFRDLELKPEQRQLLAAAPPSLRETIFDYCRNQRFRRDIYIRGRRSISDRQRDERLRQVHLVLAVRREDASVKMKLPVGEVEFAAKTYGPILDALAEAPRSIGELLDLPELKAANSTARPVELAGVLVGAGLAALVKEKPTDASRVKRFNAAMAELIANDANPRSGVLIAPTLQNGISYSPLEIVMHAEVARAPRSGAEEIANRIIARLEATGSGVRREGKPIADDPSQLSQYAQEIAALMARRVPLWQRLGIL